MTESLENLYFNWLCAKVMDHQNMTPSKSYYNLMRILQSTEFIWLLSGDDNRAADGLDLRKEFLLLADIPDHPEWREFPPCSILEMLIAFSRRAEFMTDIPANECFWDMLDNLDLKRVNDGTRIKQKEIDEILESFIWRTYDVNGTGGLFPVDSPREDQRHVEIWYQFCGYLLDHERLS